MRKCGHFLRDPRGRESTDPQGRKGWYCARPQFHPVDPEANQYHQDAARSRRWSSEGLSPRQHSQRQKQQAAQRMF